MSLGPYSELSEKLSVNVPEFPLDGTFKRFGENGKKPFWAVGVEWEFKKKTYQAIHYGSWKSGEKFTWKSYEEQPPSSTFSKKEKENIDFIKQKIRKEQEKKWDECAQKWLQIFNSCPTFSPKHEYCSTKGLKDNHVARISNEGKLLIPIYHGHDFAGCQIIYRIGSGFKKIYSKGIRKAGSFSYIGNVFSSNYIYVCEGFSTGATIYELTGIPVLIALDKGNLKPCIFNIKKLNTNVKIVIASDYDQNEKESENGQTFAIECAEYFNNVSAIFPTNTSGSDFNDLFLEKGIEETKKQLEFDKSKFEEIVFLGHCDIDKFVYFSTQTLNLHVLSASKHDRNNILAVAPKKYWGDRFGCWAKDRDGNQIDDLNYSKLISELFEAQREIGHFNSEKIKGIGVHRDNGEMAVNLGDRLFYKGQERTIFDKNFKTNFFYQASKRIDIDFSKKWTQEDGEKLIKTIAHFKFSKPSEIIITSGWIAMAQVFGALKWRPHIWITGSKGSGKTTLLQFINEMIPFSLKVENSTEAGLRQEIKSDAKAIIFDESESNTPEGKRKMTRVLEMARSCSSNTNSISVKGTPSGNAIKYHSNAIFCMGSIQTMPLNSADRSRFFVLEMNEKRKSQGNWKWAINSMYELEKKKENLFVHMVQGFKQIEKNIIQIKEFLINKGVSDRESDQISSILACYHALYEISDITIEFIEDTLKQLDLSELEYLKDNRGDDADDCLDMILQSIIDRSSNKTIGYMIEDSQGDYSMQLSAYGIKSYGDKIAIHAKNKNLIKILDDTHFHDIGKLLSRHKNLIENKLVKVGNKVHRCYILKV